MTIIYADNVGNILGLWQPEGDGTMPDPSPPEHVEALTFDPYQNLDLLMEIAGEPTKFRLLAGVLTRDGNLVVMNPPSAIWQAQIEATDAKIRILEAINTALADYEAALAHWDTLTMAQQKAVLRRLIQVQMQLLRYHRRELL